MDLRLSRIEKLVVDNSPALLTAIGTAGTVTTAVLAVKAGYQYNDILRELEGLHLSQASIEDRQVEPISNQEMFEASWKTFAPTVVAGALTISAFVGANRIGTRRAAGLAAAYTISEKLHDEYRSKVTSKIGANEERKIRDEVAQDRVNRTSGSTQVVISGTDELCFDAFTGRYFRSNVEAIKKAQNDLNYKVLHEGYASLSEFYDNIGLPATDYSEEVGWRAEQLLDIEFSTTLSEDQKPCISIQFHHMPVRGYYKFG